VFGGEDLAAFSDYGWSSFREQGLGNREQEDPGRGEAVSPVSEAKRSIRREAGVSTPANLHPPDFGNQSTRRSRVQTPTLETCLLDPPANAPIRAIFEEDLRHTDFRVPICRKRVTGQFRVKRPRLYAGSSADLPAGWEQMIAGTENTSGPKSEQRALDYPVIKVASLSDNLLGWHNSHSHTVRTDHPSWANFDVFASSRALLRSIFGNQ
jgi:hypothetical protein